MGQAGLRDQEGAGNQRHFFFIKVLSEFFWSHKIAYKRNVTINSHSRLRRLSLEFTQNVNEMKRVSLPILVGSDGLDTFTPHLLPPFATPMNRATRVPFYLKQNKEIFLLIVL